MVYLPILSKQKKYLPSEDEARRNVFGEQRRNQVRLNQRPSSLRLLQISVNWCKNEGPALEADKGEVTRFLDAYIQVKGLSLGHSTCHLKIYKKNSLRVFLSKREKFCPSSRSLIVCLIHFDIFDVLTPSPSLYLALVDD